MQAALVDNRVERVTRSTSANPSILAGLVFDAGSERMSPTHANKKGTRYRYYVSQSLIKRGRPKASEAACRVPAADLETLVEHRICALLRDEAAMLEVAGSATVAMYKSLIEAAADLAHRWPALRTPEKHTILHALVERVDICPGAVDISARPAVLPAVVQRDFDIRRLPALPERSLLVLSVPASVRRTGMETRLIVQGASGSHASRAPDRSLLRLIAQAHHLHAMVMAGAGKSISELAAEAKLSRSYFTRVFRLSFLAPDVTKAIVQGRQPFEFSAIKLMQAGPPPPNWSQQRRKLGLA